MPGVASIQLLWLYANVTHTKENNTNTLSRPNLDKVISYNATLSTK